MDRTAQPQLSKTDSDEIAAKSPPGTKIVATMGPALDDDNVLRSCLAGIDVCRLNFSHGELDGHLELLERIRRISGEMERPVAILGDLGGPKIRVGDVEDIAGTGGMPVATGDYISLQRDTVVGKGHVISCTYAGLIDDVEVGHRLLIEDGLLRFVCVDKSDNSLGLQCTAGGVIKTRKGINLPRTAINLPSVTERDWRCVDWAIEHNLDYVALSFVRRAEELYELREYLARKQSPIHLISKIEKEEAVSDIDRIIEASDAVMIARGDLGVEVDLARVPLIQKDILTKCRRRGKPTIVATQMLQSMVDNPSPTRAEVSDVANAIFDGADAIMLSGETSVGKFPVNVVHTMRHIAETSEKYVREHGGFSDGVSQVRQRKVIAAASRAVRSLVDEVGCKLVVLYSHTGDTARLFSKQRLRIPVVALGDDATRLRQMSLYFGVVPVKMATPRELTELVPAADARARELSLAKAGDRIIVVAGRSMGTPGAMNGIVLHTVGSFAQENNWDG